MKFKKPTTHLTLPSPSQGEGSEPPRLTKERGQGVRWFPAWLLTASAFLIPQAALAQNITLGVPIGGQTSVTGLPQYIALVYRYSIGIVATVAIVMVVYGGFRYLLGAGLESVKRGKEIIKDALIGMIVVLGAYVILNTVNPATLTLSMPAIKKIQRQELQLNYVPPISAALGMNRPCATDLQCFVPGEAASVGEDCLLYTDLNPNAGGNLTFTNHSGGACTKGVQGQLCGCSGSGCTVTSGAPGNHGSNVGRFFASRLSEADLAANQGALRVHTANHNWTGVVECRSGLTCVPGNADTHFAHTYPLATCDNVVAVTPDQLLALPEITSDRTNQTPCSTQADCASRPGLSCKHYGVTNNGLCRRACTTNANCGSGACIWDIISTDGRGSGWCSFGGLADVCRCTGTGCNAANDATHSVSVPCGEGLQCGTIPRTIAGVLIPSLGWDYICVPRTIQAPPSATSGLCSFVCRNLSTTPVQTETAAQIGDRHISCDGATQAAADAACASICQTGANSCGILRGAGWECFASGTGAARPQCTGWLPHGR